MICATCGREVMREAAFCPYCGGKVVQGAPEADRPVYLTEVKRVLKSGKLIVYRDRTEFVTSSIQKAIFSYDNLVAVKKEWDHIDFITEDGHKESCPADRKCVHEAFLHIEQAVKPYLDQRKDQLLSQGVRYSFPSSQGLLNDGVLNLSAEQAEFKAKSGKSEVVSFRDVKSVSAAAGTLDFLLFDRQMKSFAVGRELRDEVLAFVTASVAPYLARRQEELLARGIYFSFPGPDGWTVDLLEDRVQRGNQLGQTDAVFFRDVRTATVYIGTLELALTDGTSKMFSIDEDAGNEVLAFVTKAIEPYVRARTEGFDAAFGIDERLEINAERGVFHVIRQSGREITDEWPLEALTQCRWEERKDLNALGSVVSGGIALFKSAARAAGNQAAAETEERLSCAGVVLTLGTGQEVRVQSVWFGLFPAGMSRTNKKYERYLAEWAGLSDFLSAHCPECEQIEPEEPALPEPEVRLPEPESGGPEPLQEADSGGGPEASRGLDAADHTEQQDVLGIANYIDGISRFIDNCSTPMTIAFQGNWGSGENSVLRILFTRLGEQSGNHQLWFNVRQFAQGESGQALSVLVGKKLVGLFGGDEIAGKSGVIITSLAGLVTNKIVGDSSIGKEVVGGLLNKPAADSPEQLVELFAKKAAGLGKTGKVVLFIDGLDWLAPARAVELLEAMRIFFTCQGCVFVVATDYSAVLSGIRERYGQGLDETRGKVFFDELFKMSFRVPASSYNLHNYVRSKLEQLGIQAVDEDEPDLYVALIHNSVGKDLESVDRLFASFQLIVSMAGEDLYASRYNRLALFALLCMQMFFREVYDSVVQRKDSVTPEFLAGLCGCSPLPWGADQVSDEEKEAFQGFGGVFARIINQDGDAGISAEECRAFAKVLEFSSITSK